MVEFEKADDKKFDSFKGKNIDFLKYAMAVAVCGRHNIIAVGSPGCGKTAMFTMFPMLMPELTADEMKEVNKIYEVAGIPRPDDLKTPRPFRMPHQTASLEGMCGGGIDCKPGEISLAHKGMLFLDEVAEFRTSVLQMLRVPLETKSVTLSRAGKCYVYPADFQLAMVTSPCPCGNYGSDRICICSARSIEQYWKKFSGPLLDRMEIRVMLYETHTTFEPERTLEELRELIKKGQEFQYVNCFEVKKLTKRGEAYYNNHKYDDPQTLHEKLLSKGYSVNLHYAKKVYGR